MILVTFPSSATYFMDGHLVVIVVVVVVVVAAAAAETKGLRLSWDRCRP